jgi:hypothetical protein
MSDNLQKRRPQDASRINTSEQWEIDYWTETLGVSEADLKEAIKAVGNSSDNVRKYLRK